MLTPEETEDVFAKIFSTCVTILIAILFLVLAIGFGCGKAFGQDFDGICRLSCNGKQWSGVAISSTQILTVAHPEESKAIRAEFPERGHGAFNRIGIEATMIRDDLAADLALLSYKCPEYATIKTYVVNDVRADQYLIRGYVRDQAMIMKTNLLSDSEILDGHRVLTLRGLAIHGMSGSPVTVDDEIVGIQFGITKTDTNAVSAETIIKFLEAK